MAAIASVKPGQPIREFGNIITNVVKPQGLSVVRSYCGHGIGDLFHCAPNVPHYQNNKAAGVCKPGMVFTIEPMINEGGWEVCTQIILFVQYFAVYKLHDDIFINYKHGFLFYLLYSTCLIQLRLFVVFYIPCQLLLYNNCRSPLGPTTGRL